VAVVEGGREERRLSACGAGDSVAGGVHGVYMVMAWGREGGVHLRPAELFVY
jgi:hypothetical protein